MSGLYCEHLDEQVWELTVRRDLPAMVEQAVRERDARALQRELAATTTRPRPSVTRWLGKRLVQVGERLVGVGARLSSSVPDAEVSAPAAIPSR